MITQYTSVLIPGWVAAGKFPDGDEDQLREISAAWTSMAAGTSGAEADVQKCATMLFTAWTGDAATGAQAQVATVQKWIASITG